MHLSLRNAYYALAVCFVKFLFILMPCLGKFTYVWHWSACLNKHYYTHAVYIAKIPCIQYLKINVNIGSFSYILVWYLMVFLKGDSGATKRAHCSLAFFHPTIANSNLPFLSMAERTSCRFTWVNWMPTDLRASSNSSASIVPPPLVSNRSNTSLKAENKYKRYS